MKREMTAAEFLGLHGIGFSAERIPARTNRAETEWDRSASHWACTFTFLGTGPLAGRKLACEFSQGSALTEPPTGGDVFSSLLMDARCVRGRTFAEWAGEFGYSDDSIKALRLYQLRRKSARELRAFLGPQTFRKALDNVTED